MKYVRFICLSFLFLSCVQTPKKNQSNNTPRKSEKTFQNLPKQKVGNNTYEKALKRTLKYATNLHFDLETIRIKGLPDKKYFAEFLGLYLKIKKALKTDSEKANLLKRLEPYYQQTLQSEFHNLSKVNDKLFKKNSMSYIRIMWLLSELGFDISYYKKAFFKIKSRMDNHLKIRGEWQKVVFSKYYDFFKFDKPKAIQNTEQIKGPISKQEPLSYYNRANAYVLTHFIFAAYDYGNKTTQSVFSMADFAYLSNMLPLIIQKFELKKNDDLVAELLTCLVLINETKTTPFKSSFKGLLNRQNNDGSFGDYERGRKKYGNDVEFRWYLHTTLVAIETFIEFEYRNKSEN
jgi:hypothetical protein